MQKNGLCVALICFLLIIFYSNTGFAQVNYKLEGILTAEKNRAKLTTDDGRLFILEGKSAAKFLEFNGKSVLIHGSVRQADQLEILRVKKIVEIKPEQGKIVLPEFKPRQRAPILSSNKDGVLTVGNFRWRILPGKFPAGGLEEHRFEVARIRPEMVENVYLVLKPFPPEWLSAHSMFLFTFKDGGIITTKGEKTTGMFLSIEAWQQKDQVYSLKDGFKDLFGSCWILTSWEDYIDEITYRKEHLVMYPLKINKEQARKMAEETILQSCVNRRGEYYHTITNNCTNNLIVLLNRVLPEKKQIDLWLIPKMAYNFRASLPVTLPKYLLRKKLLVDKIYKVDPEAGKKKPAELGL